MAVDKEVNELVNAYCGLRDRQHAVYDRCAKRHNLTVNELFVLDILWFAPDGCTQKEICERLSANKQTIAAITGRFLKKGYIRMEEVAKDRRNKRIRFTDSGKTYAPVSYTHLDVYKRQAHRAPQGAPCRRTARR